MVRWFVSEVIIMLGTWPRGYDRETKTAMRTTKLHIVTTINPHCIDSLDTPTIAIFLSELERITGTYFAASHLSYIKNNTG